MREELTENISYLIQLTWLGFDPDSQAAGILSEHERRERVFLSRHCLDEWDLEAALRNMRDSFMDTTEVEGPTRRKFKNKKTTKIEFDHCEDVIEAMRYLYLLDEDDKTSVKKEFENKFLWHCFILPIIHEIKLLDMCDIKRPAVMMVAVDAVIGEVRRVLSEYDTEHTFEDAMIARGVMMSRMA